jgi:hypothetical protein
VQNVPKSREVELAFVRHRRPGLVPGAPHLHALRQGGVLRGTSLRPVPPSASKGKDTRYINICKGDEFDEAQMANWVKQAAALPGWVP